MKHSNVFYRFCNGRFLPVKKAKAIRSKTGFDLFRIDHSIYEGKTGYRVQTLFSRDEMLEFISKLESDEAMRSQIRDSIESTIVQSGISPRYTQPDVKYIDIFKKPVKNEQTHITTSTEQVLAVRTVSTVGLVMPDTVFDTTPDDGIEI
jgi:hypothetical protein